MDLFEAKTLALQLMSEHRILPGYCFKFDTRLSRAGACNKYSRTIILSEEYIKINDKDEVVDIILHEIAHALVTDNGHGKEWKTKAISIGCSGNRLFYGTSPARTKKYWCPTCGKISAYRREQNNMYCSSCVTKNKTIRNKKEYEYKKEYKLIKIGETKND